jgi:hypothetical protein
VLRNTTNATAGVPVQISPRLKWSGAGWDTDVVAVSRPVSFFTEVLPTSGSTVAGSWKLGYIDPVTSALTYPLTVSNGGAVATSGVFTSGDRIVSGAAVQVAQGSNLYWTARTVIGSPADGQANISKQDNSAGVGFDVATDAVLKVRTLAQTGYGTVDALAYQLSGIPFGTVANGNVVAATDTGTASIATYTVGAADGTFEVSANCLVTTATTHSFSLDVTYTDESNVARTLILPVAQLAGTFITGGLITNITGAGPYEASVMTIRAKAATAITVRTAAGGTYTTVVYNARGVIKQVG